MRKPRMTKLGQSVRAHYPNERISILSRTKKCNIIRKKSLNIKSKTVNMFDIIPTMPYYLENIMKNRNA